MYILQMYILPKYIHIKLKTLYIYFTFLLYYIQYYIHTILHTIVHTIYTYALFTLSHYIHYFQHHTSSTPIHHVISLDKRYIALNSNGKYNHKSN